MSKFTNLNNLDKLSKALNNRCKELIDEEKARALAEEQALQALSKNQSYNNYEMMNSPEMQEDE